MIARTAIQKCQRSSAGDGVDAALDSFERLLIGDRVRNPTEKSECKTHVNRQESTF